MGAKHNLLKYLEIKGEKKPDFYRKTGLSNGFLDKNDHISSKNIEIIISVYADLDLYWLITGKGSMLRDASGRSSELSSSDRDEVVRLLKEKIHDQQKIIDLLEEKVEALQGGIASEMDAASTSAAGWAWYHKGPPKAPK